MARPREDRLKEVATIAVVIEANTRVPAEATVSRWAIESQWGAAPIGRANYFGIKRAARHQLFASSWTTEWWYPAQLSTWAAAHPDRPAPKVIARAGDKLRVRISDDFADYPSLRASCEDFAWLVSHGAPYAKAWATFLADGSITDLISGVAGVYATDPRSTELAVSISQQSNVRAAIAAARNQPIKQEEAL